MPCRGTRCIPGRPTDLLPLPLQDAKTSRIMYWTQAPVRSENYALRSGDGPGGEASDPTTYTPNEYMNIHLRVLKTGWKFRGLLLNAVADAPTVASSNSSNSSSNSSSVTKVVGEWRHPPEPGYPYRVDNPSCPGSLLHADADRKPYAS